MLITYAWLIQIQCEAYWTGDLLRESDEWDTDNTIREQATSIV